MLWKFSDQISSKKRKTKIKSTEKSTSWDNSKIKTLSEWKISSSRQPTSEKELTKITKKMKNKAINVPL